MSQEVKPGLHVATRSKDEARETYTLTDDEVEELRSSVSAAAALEEIETRQHEIEGEIE